ncbi:MAG: tRNA (adenosine(37)-N6)-threonylcarbamoyltransferase complex ATPase subunit type 1 TsaE [Nocardioidaceae bacterium]
MILTGDLGAGKTTFTQGLGEGLGVRGAVLRRPS